jgi:hypothetical protein
MADENTNEQGGGQQMNMDALASAMGGVFRQSLQDFAQEQESRARQAQEEQSQAQRQAEFHQLQAQQPVAQAVLPVVAPHINQAILEAQSATDAALFYGATPESIKYKDDIEAAFNRLKAQGTPLKREEVWAWYRGKNMKKFVEGAIAEQQAAAEHARQATEAGSGHRTEANTPQALKDPYGSSFEELDKAMKNVSF